MKTMIDRDSQQGFNLIEMMIAIAVVAILAVVALPAYEGSVQRSARTEAQGALMELAQFMERNFTTNNCYHRTDRNCAAVWVAGQNGSVVLPINRSPRTGAVIHYNINFQGNPLSTSFIIRAVPRGGQANDECGTLSVDHRGVREARRNGALVQGCW